MKQRLLADFVTESIVVVMNQSFSITTDDGIGDAPIVLEGILLDYDDTFALIEAQDTGSLSLVALDKIVKIDKQDTQAIAAMSDPNKPSPDEMN